jgi:hypothetical protein
MLKNSILQQITQDCSFIFFYFFEKENGRKRKRKEISSKTKPKHRKEPIQSVLSFCGKTCGAQSISYSPYPPIGLYVHFAKKEIV